jgi:hypothetical protein
MLWYKINVDIIVENVTVFQLYSLSDIMRQILVRYASGPFVCAY